MPDLTVDVRIERSRADVLRWWTEFPDDYRAVDPREQPHRIEVLHREPGVIETMTYWRVPLLRELRVRETFRFRKSGDFDVEVQLPFHLRQRDSFTFTERDGGTDVHVEVDVWPRSPWGRLARPFFMMYARRNYPRTWRSAARICAAAQL